MRRWTVSMVAMVVAAAACGRPPAGGEAGGPVVTLGAPDSLLFWRGAQQLEGYRNMDDIFPTRVIEAGEEPLPLPATPVDFSGLSFTLGEDTFDLDGFIDHNSIVGLLVIKDSGIALERYERGNTRDTKWVSYSISKSVVSLLVGAAVRDGYIRDLDVSVTEYLPMLEGSAYEPVTIRHALHMVSGVQWSDDYDDPESDINRSLTTGTLALLEDLGSRERVADPGEQFNYNTGETHLLGTVLRAAIGNNLATYLSSEIWRPFGMESDGFWMLAEPSGGEYGGCCFSAVLRDYGRLGLFAMGGGVLPSGEAVLADGWMREATESSPANPGYGYLWWIQEEGAYAAIGIFGQMIWIDPAESLVVVTHSAWPEATSYFGHGYAFARAVRETLSAPGLR